MGLFDSVFVPCPDCGLESEFQSKGSTDCYCRRFTLEDAPDDVLSDVNSHSPSKCLSCGTEYEVGFHERTVTVKIPYSKKLSREENNG